MTHKGYLLVKFGWNRNKNDMYIYLQGDLSIGSYSNYFNTENDDRKKTIRVQ